MIFRILIINEIQMIHCIYFRNKYNQGENKENIGVYLEIQTTEIQICRRGYKITKI